MKKWRSAALALLAALPLAGASTARTSPPQSPSPTGSKAAALVASFNVPGPTLAVNVHRGQQTLPIFEVPRLQPGDVLSVKSGFTAHEAVHWLLISGFLRGATDPPPEKWFSQVALWKNHNWNHPQHFTVPAGAQQGLLFLAPDSGGGFSTLRNTVRRQPNLFLRVSTDMIRATAEKGKLDSFLMGMKAANPTGNPETAGQRSIALANSLSIGVNGQCFNAAQQQVPCLVQNTDQVLANPSHLQSAANLLTSMPSASLIGSVVSSQLGAAYFPYVGAFVDVVHLLGAARTANYQYLPALPEVQGNRIQLKLNHDPAFKNPKSVLVYVLPKVAADDPPHIVIDTENHPTCLGSGATVLPADAPASLYSTRYGHDWTLTLSDADGQTQSGIPLTPDPAQGGFVVPDGAVHLGQFAHVNQLQGTIQGQWGFKTVQIPAFRLQHALSGHWQLEDGQQENVVTGNKVTLRLSSPSAACIASVQIRDGQGHSFPAKVTHPTSTTVAAAFDLNGASSGQGALDVQQSGINKPDKRALRVYDPLPTVKEVTYYAQDTAMKVQGERLAEIASAEVGGQNFHPADPVKDRLRLVEAGAAPALTTGASAHMLVHLQDGRTMTVPFTVQAPRPVVKVLRLQPRVPASAVVLQNPNAVPQNAEVSITLASVTPSDFQPDEKLQIRSSMQSQPAELQLSHGLMLQDQHTVIADFVPSQLLGASTFGKLDFRVIDGRGVAGDWQPLPQVVRLPQLKEVRCPLDLKQGCTLIGDNLYLITAIGTDEHMHHAVKVPEGFNGTTIGVPRPSGATLYIRLRDDPDGADPVLLPVLPELQPKGTAAPVDESK